MQLINPPSELAYRIRAALYVRTGWINPEGAMWPTIRSYVPGPEKTP